MLEGTCRSLLLAKAVGNCYALHSPWQEVERKCKAMLQMYGEKVEEAEELKLDIDDLKTMYRQQVCVPVKIFL